MTGSEEAAAALRSLDEANAKVAANYDYPFSRHLLFGLLMGALIAGQALPRGTSTIVSALVIIGTVLVQKWDRKRTGTWLHGMRPGKTRRIALLMIPVIVALILPATYYGHRGAVRVPLVLGVVGTLIGVGFSYWWQRVYLAELREGGRA